MIRPVGYCVLVKPDYEKEHDLGNGQKLVIAQSSRQGIASVDTGTVVAIGPTAWQAYDDGQAWCAVGDRIGYARHGGRIIKDPETDVEYVLIADADVRVIITGEKKNG